MFTSDHTAFAEQSSMHLFKQVVSVQSPVATGTHLSNANALLVNLLAASPACAPSFALSMHERLCECGNFDNADVWEVVLQLCRHSTPFNNPELG